MSLAIEAIAPAAVGAGVGGAGVVWLAKFLLGRMIKQYDKRHDEQAAKLERLADRFNDTLIDLKTKLAVLENRAAGVDAMRTDIKEIEKRVAVVEPAINRAHERLDNFKAALKSGQPKPLGG